MGIKIQALCPGYVSTEFHEVGDLQNFNRNDVPDSLWMSPDRVVSLSLKALGRSRKTIFIPGRKHRFIKCLIMNSSLIRKALQNKTERDLK